MNLVEIETFVAILEEGSMVGAARRLHVTQSTVTARLQNLEREIGSRLVDRSKAGASATVAGERIRRNADTIIELWRQAQRDAGLPNAVTAVCSIGCHPDLWASWGIDIVGRARQSDPTLALSVRQGSAAELAEWQRSGLVDVSITPNPAIAPGHEIRSLGTETLVLVANEPDAATEFNPDYVFVDGGEDFARDHAATYARASIARVSFDTAWLGLTHLLEHGGSAYLPLSLVKGHIETGRLHRLEAATFRREAYLVMATGAEEPWPWLTPN